MDKIYQETFLLRTSQCDFRGTWRPSAIFEAMQEASGMHSHLLGCGRDALIKQGYVWVLSRMEVQMCKYPGVGDTVTVETFPMNNRRWFFPRYFIFRNVQGDELGYSSSLWVLLDLETRKMAPPDKIVHLIPDNSDLTAPMGLPSTVMEAEGKEKLFTRTPAYSDLDVNNHVNNARYVDWLCDALGYETLGKQTLRTICINYEAEVRPEQAVELKLTQQGGAFSLSGYHEDKRHFSIGGTLMDRM
jgi:medium-chain acyl-[acyl-carrier-protein] hydrolase